MAPQTSNATYDYTPTPAASPAAGAQAPGNREYVSLYTEHVHVELLGINKHKSSGIRVAIADGASLRFRAERKIHGLTTLWKDAVAVHDLSPAPLGVQTAQCGFTRAFSQGGPNPSWAHVRVAFGLNPRTAAAAHKHVIQLTADTPTHSYFEADFKAPANEKQSSFKITSAKTNNRLSRTRQFKMMDGTDKTVKELHNFCSLVANNVPDKLLTPLLNLHKKYPQFITWASYAPNTPTQDTVPSARPSPTAEPSGPRKRPAAATPTAPVAKKPAKMSKK
ncbi:unnamed protein product [Prorocentrum cordatum]|uniref:Uncharacterized protein n=1 Tax=Prorocentrum cordatum TaxID=2364126 RepID=A0ABN9PLX6_9DINO|nr:unnamed protein product [Polarella glacialis]